nr:MAG: hypothetical protein DIU64_11150 [Caldicoprobacter oshimai]
MKKIEECLECGQCKSRCPLGLDTPTSRGSCLFGRAICTSSSGRTYLIAYFFKSVRFKYCNLCVNVMYKNVLTFI